MRLAWISCAIVLAGCPSTEREPASAPVESGDPCALGGLRAYPPVRASASTRSVRALRGAWPAVGARVDVVGHVASIYACPPCPEGAVCKPCIGDHVVLSDTRKALTQLADDDVVVFMGDPHQLKLGDRRRFTVQVCGHHTTDATPSDLALVAYERP